MPRLGHMTEPDPAWEILEILLVLPWTSRTWSCLGNLGNPADPALEITLERVWIIFVLGLKAASSEHWWNYSTNNCNKNIFDTSVLGRSSSKKCWDVLVWGPFTMKKSPITMKFHYDSDRSWREDPTGSRSACSFQPPASNLQLPASSIQRQASTASSLQLPVSSKGQDFASAWQVQNCTIV